MCLMGRVGVEGRGKAGQRKRLGEGDDGRRKGGVRLRGDMG